MADKVFYLKYRDTLSVITVTLYDPPDEDGVRSIHDLTGATSATLFVWLSDGTKLAGRTMTIDADPTTGVLTYIWQTADWTDYLTIGEHRMEYEVLGPLSGRLTFPNNGYHTLKVLADIGQGA